MLQPWAVCGCGPHFWVLGHVAASVSSPQVSPLHSRPEQLCSDTLERKYRGPCTLPGWRGGDRRGDRQNGLVSGWNMCSLNNLWSHFLKCIMLKEPSVAFHRCLLRIEISGMGSMRVIFVHHHLASGPALTSQIWVGPCCLLCGLCSTLTPSSPLTLQLLEHRGWQLH